MPISGVSSIGTGLFVKLEIDYYKTSEAATPISQVLTFSDSIQPITFGGDTYLGLGNLVGISSTTSELKSTNSDITITISGIPNTSIAEIIHSRIKGSKVSVYRAIYNSAGGLLSGITPNPAGRFFGIVNNYSLDETYDIDARTATNTIALICSSKQELISNKVTGRKTNPSSNKAFYPTDVSMDRVPNLVGANFNFGAPK